MPVSSAHMGIFFTRRLNHSISEKNHEIVTIRDAAKVDGRKPVVCVAGMASGSLEVRHEGGDEAEGPLHGV